MHFGIASRSRPLPLDSHHSSLVHCPLIPFDPSLAALAAVNTADGPLAEGGCWWDQAQRILHARGPSLAIRNGPPRHLRRWRSWAAHAGQQDRGVRLRHRRWQRRC